MVLISKDVSYHNVEMSASEKLELLTRITSTPGLCGGKPCIRGMRMRVVDVLEMLADGVTEAEILEDFPFLETEDLRACLWYAAERSTIPQVAA